jgi:glutamyl-tRNA synthetase
MLGFLFVADDALTIEDDALATGLKDVAQSSSVLSAAITALSGDELAGTGWNAEQLQATLRTSVVEGLGIKPKFAFGPLRVAVSGRRISPPLFESMEILGRESTLARLRALADRLAGS